MHHKGVMHTPPQLETLHVIKHRHCGETLRGVACVHQICRSSPAEIIQERFRSVSDGGQECYVPGFINHGRSILCHVIYTFVYHCCMYMAIALYIYRSLCCFCFICNPSSPRGVSLREGHPAKNSWRTSMSALFYFARGWETAHPSDPTLARSTDTYSNARGKRRLW